jgi:hypothetical protein
MDTMCVIPSASWRAGGRWWPVSAGVIETYLELRTVGLHHISWSEVLHEAQMQLAHRGVQDRVQAWLLAELVRYLEHPRSGAAGFDDMGAAWVPVREAVAANTLRARDSKAAEVTASWDGQRHSPSSGTPRVS